MAGSLKQVRAAQLRARATRRALVQIALATAFLVGALAHARSPDRHSDTSVVWMTVLLCLSTLDVALGLRMLARLRRKPAYLWTLATAAWGALSTLLVGFLLRG